MLKRSAFLVGFVLIAVFFTFVDALSFADDSESDFDKGVFNRTYWNGSSLVLSEENLSGDYISSIFDTNFSSLWLNFSYVGVEKRKMNVNLSSAINSGENKTGVFLKDGVYETIEMKDDSKRFYLNFTESLTNKSVLKIYAKKVNGATIGIYALSDSSGSNPLGTFTVSSDTGAWYNITLTLNESINAFWLGEGTDSGVDPKDDFDFIYAEVPGYNLSFEVMNCSLENCSDGSWKNNVNLSNVSLIGRYFKYKVKFVSEDSHLSPSISYASVNYLPLVNVTYVDDDFDESTAGWKATHFDKIADALTAVQAGGKVYVAEGYYLERFTIAKSASLIGEGFENTTIDGQGIAGNVITVSANKVNISGVKIIGAGTNWGNSGIYFSNAGYYVINNNFFLGNLNGLSLISAYNGKVYSNYFVNSTSYGIYTNNWATNGNYIYDNYFNNSVDFYAASQNPSNYFNVTKVAGTNIVGGSYIGGNYWGKYSGSDRGDGFGDAPYNLQGIYYDYLPLINDTAPVLSIFSPQSANYSYTQLLFLNYSVYDSVGIDSCWYVLDSGSPVNLPDCDNASFYASFGNHILFLYANDSSGKESFANVSFYSFNTAPAIHLIEPLNGTIYGYNESILLSFSVEDEESDVSECWYNLGNENVTISNCSNTTFDVPGNADYSLTIYVNDSLGEFGSDFAEFQVSLGAPTLVVYSPSGEFYADSGEVEIEYSASDIDLDSCELWGNFTGNFSLNQTAYLGAGGSGDFNFFNLILPDGAYLWGLKCNDTSGNFALSENKSLYVDTIGPLIFISEPSGIKNSRSGISLVFSVEDASPTSCYYNVYRGSNVEIYNTSIDYCVGPVYFNVTVDADFTLNFYINDYAGNFNFTSTSFSVDTSPEVVIPDDGDEGSGGGGGAGGGFGGVLGKPVLEVDAVKVISSIGEVKSLKVIVKNTGRTSANKCKLVGDSNYFEASDLQNIGIGEIVEFDFVLKVTNAEARLAKLNVSCLDNVSSEVPLGIIILENKLNVNIDAINFSKNTILIGYHIDPSVSSEESLFFQVLNSDQELVKEENRIVSLESNEAFYDQISINLPENQEAGMMKLAIGNGEDIIYVEESFLYGGSLITGFVLADFVENYSYIGIILILFIVALIFVLRRIFQLKKAKKGVVWKREVRA